MWYLLQSAVILGLMYFYLNDPTTTAPLGHVIIFCVFMSYVATWVISKTLDLLISVRRIPRAAHGWLVSHKSGGSRLGVHIKHSLPNSASSRAMKKRR